MSTKKVSLEDLILRKQQGNFDKLQVKYYDSEELGGKIEVRKIPIKKYMELVDGMESDNGVESLEFMCQLVYQCCPLFNTNSKELMQTYDCAEPIELPIVVLNDNFAELTEISELINSFYHLDKIDEKVKK